MVPAWNLAPPLGSCVYDYARTAEVNERPKELQKGAAYHMLSLSDIAEKAAKVVEERESKAAVLAGDISEPEIVETSIASAPSLGALAAKRAAAAQAAPPKKRVKAPKRAAARSLSPSRSVAVSASGTGTRKPGKGIKSSLDTEVAELFRKHDPDLHQCMERVGYIPDCFVNVTLNRMFLLNKGRSLYQACLFFWGFQGQRCFEYFDPKGCLTYVRSWWSPH